MTRTNTRSSRLTELATTWIGYVDRDGAIETLFAYHPTGGRGAAALFCFTNTGALAGDPRVERPIVVFPRPRVNQALEVTNRVLVVTFDDQSLRVNVGERERDRTRNGIGR
ncbi:MAG: hypothetical protein HY654_10855 [Acidobacteria bacterium]|nr:hypothetical protein [Acidobacteriota bacterium]